MKKLFFVICVIVSWNVAPLDTVRIYEAIKPACADDYVSYEADGFTIYTNQQTGQSTTIFDCN